MLTVSKSVDITLTQKLVLIIRSNLTHTPFLTLYELGRRIGDTFVQIIYTLYLYRHCLINVIIFCFLVSIFKVFLTTSFTPQSLSCVKCTQPVDHLSVVANQLICDITVFYLQHLLYIHNIKLNNILKTIN